MTNRFSLERLSHALEHAFTRFLSSAPPPAATTPGLTIVLSRQAGTPGSAVAQEVGRRLGWPVFDRELLECIAAEMHLRPNLLKEFDERPAPWFIERVETFLARPPASESAYVEHLIHTLQALAARGHAIIVGRGAAHLLPEATTLRVRLIAPLKDRIDFLSREEGLSPERAAQRVATLDRERAEFIRKHFRADADDVNGYDLLLNCARFSVDQCAALILDAARLREEKTAPAAAVGAGRS